MKYNFEYSETHNFQKEIELPYFAKDAAFLSMITEDEVIITVKAAEWISEYIDMNTKDSLHYDSTLKTVLKDRTQISKSEFMDQYNATLNKIRNAVESSTIFTL